MIKIETLDDKTIEGKLITMSKLNEIARKNCVGLTYLMNVMDVNSVTNTCYMWFKDDSADRSYLVELKI